MVYNMVGDQNAEYEIGKHVYYKHNRLIAEDYTVESKVISRGALYFHNDDNPSDWAYHIHICRFMSREQKNSGFISRWRI